MEELTEYESVKYWIDELSTRSENTRQLYKIALKKFCRWSGKNPDELIAMRKQDLEAEDQKIRHRTESLLKKFIASLKKEGYSFSTQKWHYGAIRNFFDIHYLPLELRRSDAPSGEAVGKRIPSKAEVRAMLDAAPTLTHRCLIAFLKDSGWRLSDALETSWGDIEEMTEDYWHIKRVTKKRRVVALGFIGPETTRLLKAYKRYRQEKIRENITSKSPLFKSERGDRLGYYKALNSVSRVLRKTAERAGVKDVSAHSLRKFHRANLEPYLPSEWIKTMQGKKHSGSTGPYTERRPEKLLEGYMKAYPKALSLEPQPAEVDIDKVLTIAELIAKAQREHPEKYEEIKRLLGSVSVGGPSWKERVEMAKKLLEIEEPANCSNDNCQRIVTEEELADYLSHGWHVEAVLPSGKIVIDNNHH